MHTNAEAFFPQLAGWLFLGSLPAVFVLGWLFIIPILIVIFLLMVFFNGVDLKLEKYQRKQNEILHNRKSRRSK